jgi:NADH-quinone oxidoreductase subunit A
MFPNSSEEYYFIAGLLVTGFLLRLALLLLSTLFGKSIASSEKITSYECGFRAFEDTRDRFDVRFYLVGILFLVFDLEIVFLFPWCVSLGCLPRKGFMLMLLFLFLLGLGFLYELQKGRLDWE